MPADRACRARRLFASHACDSPAVHAPTHAQTPGVLFKQMRRVVKAPSYLCSLLFRTKHVLCAAESARTCGGMARCLLSSAATAASSEPSSSATTSTRPTRAASGASASSARFTLENQKFTVFFQVRQVRQAPRSGGLALEKARPGAIGGAATILSAWRGPRVACIISQIHHGTSIPSAASLRPIRAGLGPPRRTYNARLNIKINLKGRLDFQTC